MGRRSVRKRSPRAAGAAPAWILPARSGEGAAAGSYLSCFSGNSACSGRWLALPQSQLLSRGCLPHCTRPGAPRPARLAAGREETGAGPIRAAVVGGAGAGRGREPEASRAGRAPKPSAAAGGGCGKEPSAGGRTSLPARFLSMVHTAIYGSRESALNSKLPYAANLTVQRLTGGKKEKPGTILLMKSS